MQSRIHHYLSWLGLCLLLLCGVTQAAGDYTLFESGQTRPLAISPDGTRLFAVNTPDNSLEIFAITPQGLRHLHSVAVGLEPIAVAARDNIEVWVVNHLSDSVSIIDTAANPPRVMRTLLVGDEPGDIVFAGPNRQRAFITAAHRGQNSPYTSTTNPGELTTPGIGRADVWVFDAVNPGAALGGTPLTIVKLFGDTPKALAVSPDGGTVYAAVHKSGNRTTAISEGAVCDGGASAGPCNVSGATAPGGLPAPNQDSNNVAAPETGLIVKFNGSQWVDELNRNWTSLVRFNLPDRDVFAINANANPPTQTAAYSGVGTVLFNMIVNPANGKLYVSNTEAINEVRFEGERPQGSTVSSVRGKLHQARVSVIDLPGGGTITPRHLNPHIDYNASSHDKAKSLAIPRGMAFNADASLLFVAAQGSSRIGVIPTANLENGSYTPDATAHIPLAGGGPTGLVMDSINNRLYALTRFDNAVAVIDVSGNPSEIQHLPMHNPEPASVVDGRQFLYNADLTSSNGEASCASCHIDADKDELAWDLGDPLGSVLTNNNPFTLDFGFNKDFHPMKGPMTTQTLRGMDNHGPMHWRGDRSGANNTGGDALDEDAAFKKFNPAFVGLLGRDNELTPAEMQAFTDFILQVTPPPNPIRNLDDNLTSNQQAGRDIYFNRIVDSLTCNGCHELNPSQGFFGANGRSSFEGEPQHFKIAQLRNMYEKVGMFGMPAVPFFLAGDNAHKGDQIRGFGFLHDGSVDSLFRFLRASLFNFANDTQRRQVEQFVFAFDSNLKPVVGQQVTLTNSNNSTVLSRITLMQQQTALGNADLVVRGVIDGKPRGWLSTQGNGNFKPDTTLESDWSDSALRAVAGNPETPLTYLAVPPGTGHRIALDRDRDGVLNADDNCPTNPDINQADLDSDGIGDICDDDRDGDGLSNDQEIALGINPDNPDSDGDTLSDGDEVNLYGTHPAMADTDGDGLRDDTELHVHNTDPTLADTDSDGLSDGAEVNDFQTDPTVADLIGDVAPRGAPDGVINAGDYVVLMRLVVGQITPTNQERAWADVNQDGSIDVRDMLVLRSALGL